MDDGRVYVTNGDGIQMAFVSKSGGVLEFISRHEGYREMTGQEKSQFLLDEECYDRNRS